MAERTITSVTGKKRLRVFARIRVFRGQKTTTEDTADTAKKTVSFRVLRG